MLRIYWVCLEMVKEVRPYAERIAEYDGGMSRQLKDASASVVLNVAEGSGNRAGRRRNAYQIALGEAQETRACLQVAQGLGYIDDIAPPLLGKLRQIIGTLVKLVR